MFTFVRWNLIIIAPPLVITKEELEQGLAVIGQTLDYTDGCCN